MGVLPLPPPGTHNKESKLSVVLDGISVALVGLAFVGFAVFLGFALIMGL